VSDFGLNPSFVAREASGAWARWQPVPGLAALSGGGPSLIQALACGQAGWCAITGLYWRSRAQRSNDRPGTAFVASARDGVWGKAQPVPGLAALYSGRTRVFIQQYYLARPVMPTTISCDNSGTCTLAGYYLDRSVGHDRPFVVTSRDGAWGTAQPIAASATLGGPGAGDVEISQLTCPAPGNCTAAGNLNTTDPAALPGGGSFVVTEHDGTWGQAEPLPLGTQQGGSEASYHGTTVTGLSCAAPGHCAVAGYYGFYNDICEGEYEICPQYNIAAIPFLISQVRGQWGTPRLVPGHAKPKVGVVPMITSISCGRSGRCALGGYTATFTMSDISNGNFPRNRAFVATQAGRTLSPLTRVPGVPPSGGLDSEVDRVFCSARCVAIGDYTGAIFATTLR
jgi:hypothetical protein